MATAIAKGTAKPQVTAGASGVSTTTDAARTMPAVDAREAVRLDRQMLHGAGLGSHVYASQIKVVANDAELQDTAFGHAADVLRRLNCRNPLEEMLAMQALWAHARVARLSALANSQSSRDNLRTINDACDRASDTYRKLMLAMAEYRRPPRPAGVHVTAFGQANVAQQQVVHAVIDEKPPNEQG